MSASKLVSFHSAPSDGFHSSAERAVRTPKVLKKQKLHEMIVQRFTILVEKSCGHGNDFFAFPDHWKEHVRVQESLRHVAGTSCTCKFEESHGENYTSQWTVPSHLHQIKAYKARHLILTWKQVQRQQQRQQ